MQYALCLVQDGYTPLHYAAQAGNVDMGNMLLQKDTNLFLHTNVGYIHLVYCIRTCICTIIKH